MATEVKVPVLGESITEGTLARMAQAARRRGRAGRGDRQPRDRQGQRRSAFAGRGRDGRAEGRGGDTVAVGAVIASIEEGGAAAPDPGRAGRREIDQPAGAGENPELREAAAPRRRAGHRAGRERRCGHDHVAGGPPRGARASCRPDEDQGHGPRRAPDQGRRARGGEAQKCGAPAKAEAQAEAKASPAPAAPAPRPAVPASAGNRAAMKSASRCRGFARPSPSG